MKRSVLSVSVLSLTSLLSILVVLAPIRQCARADQPTKTSTKDKWAAFRPLIGKWKGVGKGPTGKLVQQVEWKFVLNGKFLQSTSSSHAPGDHHQDIGLISFDKSRGKFVYRAFHSEGFVNQYVAEISSDGRRIVFKSESIENGPRVSRRWKYSS